MATLEGKMMKVVTKGRKNTMVVRKEKRIAGQEEMYDVVDYYK